VQERAESKDYLDLHALVQAGLPLERILAAAMAIHGESFNPAITLKAIMCFEDGDLCQLPEAVKTELAQWAAAIAQIGKVGLLSSDLAD